MNARLRLSPAMNWLSALLSLHLVTLAALSAAEVVQFSQPAMLRSTDTQGTNFQRGVNFQSFRGVPLSSTIGDPSGSDGRQPNPNSAQTNQFRVFLSFGSVVRAQPSPSETLDPGLNYAQNARRLKLPAYPETGPVSIVLISAQVGGSYYSRPASLLFGSVIARPPTDEGGSILPTNVAPTDYWAPEPYTTDNHASALYHYSPHARAVFAVTPGPVTVTWKKAVPGLSTAGLPAGTFVVEPGGLVYRLTNVNYIVSGSASKAPRKMYWTEGVFKTIGKPVNVPAARVSTVLPVYTPAFPATNAAEYVAPGQTFLAAATNRLQELRTLWFDAQLQQILAYNIQGRVFVELLGESRGDGTLRYLGNEIVDVYQQVAPRDLVAELGEKIDTGENAARNLELNPEPLAAASTVDPFLLPNAVSGSDRVEYYAAKETLNVNDVLVHWTEAGVEGLRWPSVYSRYQLIWPNQISRYSQFVRPLVATEAEAMETAVPLPTENAPSIQYQDKDRQGRIRAKLTDSFAFYSFLDPALPAHRSLLLYRSGEQIAFERVFSWLDESLKVPSTFAGTLATNLSSWNPSTTTFDWSAPNSADRLNSPRIVDSVAPVGVRIAPPTEEPDLAGHVHQGRGTSFNPGAYRDPFSAGFEAANLGAIIPVNAIPGTNRLEVWWFRPNRTNDVRNVANGFKSVYWPEVIGRYTLVWPAGSDEIVLASNDGSGALESLQASGTIYTQNNPDLAGYNPNEEHALMLGGQAYALRDDLNLTAGTVPALLSGPSATYSSEPYVLLDYTEADGRPAMRTFRVLREKSSAGIVFDYVVEAGRTLQPPMPLPFLPAPVAYRTNRVGGSPIIETVNYNQEPAETSGDLPTGWSSSQLTGPYSHYSRFTFRDRKNDFWVMRGLHAGLPSLSAGTYSSGSGTFSATLPS
ncbi:MAG: hypothetical protein RIS76_2492, partial [Verrucomicrobiota bacterium]